jgi:hypothetical protein
MRLPHGEPLFAYGSTTMKKMMLGLLVGSAVLGGCANESTPPSELAEDEVSVGVAFYGLTLMDCQNQATQCFETRPRRGLFSFLRRPVDCGVQLSTCVAEASAEAVLEEAEDVTSCGLEGVSCFTDAGDLESVVSCQQHVEGCVIETVDDLTGVKLPTTAEVIETAGEIVETAVEVTGEVVETAVEVTGEVVETAVDVTGEVVDTAVTVVEETVETAGEVITTTVDKVDGAVDCAQESRQCWRDTRDFFGCQSAYRACLRDL